MPVFTPLYQDPFAPVLFNSPPLVLTDEQRLYIREILETACSDSRFAEKAYVAIARVLTGGETVVAEVTSLSPDTAIIGDPSFDIHVMGTGFKSNSVIVFNGFEEPTTVVSATELTTGVNMPLWLAPAVVPVGVGTDGVLSNLMDFTFTDPVSGGLSVKSGSGKRLGNEVPPATEYVAKEVKIHEVKPEVKK